MCGIDAALRMSVDYIVKNGPGVDMGVERCVENAMAIGVTRWRLNLTGMHRGFVKGWNGGNKKG